MLIGHASMDENKKAKGGRAGDQTGKEVCTRSWYSKPWDVLLRCKDSTKAELMAQACEKACANNHIGYDQNQRNTLRSQAKANNWDLSKITVDCETDCSAFMTVCAECAGIPFNYSNAPTTRTMRSEFVKTGFFYALTDKIYLTSDKSLKRGDILVKEGSHTVMVLGNSAGASLPTLRIGSTGEYVKNVQLYLSILGYQIGNIDGIYGNQTASCVKHYQDEHGLTVDGIWGKQCWDSVSK